MSLCAYVCLCVFVCVCVCVCVCARVRASLSHTTTTTTTTTYYYYLLLPLRLLPCFVDRDINKSTNPPTSCSISLARASLFHTSQTLT